MKIWGINKRPTASTAILHGANFKRDRSRVNSNILLNSWFKHYNQDLLWWIYLSKWQNFLINKTIFASLNTIHTICCDMDWHSVRASWTIDKYSFLLIMASLTFVFQEFIWSSRQLRVTFLINHYTRTKWREQETHLSTEIIQYFTPLFQQGPPKFFLRKAKFTSEI